MSYSTWTVNGYGICTNDIYTTKEKIEVLLQLAPKFNEEVSNWLEECGIENPDLDDYLEYDQDYYSGIAYLLQQVIYEAENVNLEIAEDYDSDYYLMVCPSYLWGKLTDEERALDTQDKVNALFEKYLKVVADNDVSIDYYSVENGG